MQGLHRGARWTFQILVVSRVCYDRRLRFNTEKLHPLRAVLYQMLSYKNAQGNTRLGPVSLLTPYHYGTERKFYSKSPSALKLLQDGSTANSAFLFMRNFPSGSAQQADRYHGPEPGLPLGRASGWYSQRGMSCGRSMHWTQASNTDKRKTNVSIGGLG